MNRLALFNPAKSVLPAMLALVLPLRPLAAGTDLNGDKAVDVADAQAFLRSVADASPPAKSLDLDGDGAVGLSDALLYGRWINGLYEKPSAGLGTLYFRNPADTAAFAGYQADLKAKAAWSMTDLQQRYPSAPAAPPGYAQGQVQYESEVATALAKWAPPDWSKAQFLSQVRSQGMAVSASLSFPNYFQALDKIHTEDLPLMFTTDAMLHSIFLSYDHILMELETNVFSASLEKILDASLDYAQANYEDQNGTDVQDMLTTALLLLNPARSNVSKSAAVSANLAAVAAQQLGPFRMYGIDTIVDWTQFKPRGHYTKTPQLSAYFQAMMWLSRADLSLDLRAQPKTGGPKASFTRMKKDALILWDCVLNSGSYPAWLEFNGYVEYMVGMSDGLNMKGMGAVAQALGVTSVPEFLKSFPEARFDSVMAKGRFGAQAILSQAKEYPPGGTAELDLSPIFSFMPQRFILDSYTFSQAVFPLTAAIMPSSLQIAFALGDNSALKDMPAVQPDKVPGALGAQRALYDAISEEGWQSNLYTSWLGFLRKLSVGEGNVKVSPVFRGQAWRAKMRNTQLASWAHLRHNTILYAKQSYTGGTTCSFPKAYVEPYPEFFAAVAAYARIGGATFKGKRPAVAAYFEKLGEISGRLRDIAGRSAQGMGPTDDQAVWLKSALQSKPPMMCGAARVYDGWFMDLIYGKLEDVERGTDFTIADVHTHIQDEQGPDMVLHVATARINLAAVAVQEDSCVTLYVAPVGSYYDVLRSGTLERYNDEEWTAAVEKTPGTAVGGPIVTRPAWTAPMMGP
jgi:hypothetical protein